MERILVRFSKGEAIRFVGHLDLMRVFERAMRRAGFPVAYSEGFNPRPRMAFASALALGATSEWELCQIDLAEDLDAAQLQAALEALRRQMPPGIELHEVWPIPLERKSPYLQVKAATYRLAFSGSDAVARLKQFFQEGPGLPQARSWALDESAEGSSRGSLTIELPVGEHTGVRIRDVVETLEQAIPGLRVERLHRVRLWCEREPATVTSSAENGKYGEAPSGSDRPDERPSPAT